MGKRVTIPPVITVVEPDGVSQVTINRDAGTAETTAYPGVVYGQITFLDMVRPEMHVRQFMLTTPEVRALPWHTIRCCQSLGSSIVCEFRDRAQLQDHPDNPHIRCFHFHKLCTERPRDAP